MSRLLHGFVRNGDMTTLAQNSPPSTEGLAEKAEIPIKPPSSLLGAIGQACKSSSFPAGREPLFRSPPPAGAGNAAGVPRPS